MSERLSRRSFLFAAGLWIAAGGLNACRRQGGEPVSATATSSATPDIDPTSTATPTPRSTDRPATPTETSTATPTEALMGELEEFLGSGDWESYTTHYLAGKNHLVDETTGVAEVDQERFARYFTVRQEVAGSWPQIMQADRMFAGLFQPVVNFRDRGLDFDKRNGGQGMGFTIKDLGVLYTVEEANNLIASESLISRQEEDYKRGWILAPASKADESVLALVDNWLLLQRKNPNEGLNQFLRRQTFNRIIYGDLGVIPTDTTGDWKTVTSNGRFSISCSTYTEDADRRSDQQEKGRLLSFYPDLETNNVAEEEGETKLDARDTILVVGVVGPDNHLRVEVYTLSNTPDKLTDGSALPQNVDQGEDVSAAGYRWLPCGVGASPTPTAVPTNPDIISTATSGPRPTNEPTATSIP